MTPAEIGDFCLGLRGATTEVLWQVDQVYKVGGKMFAATGPDGSLSFKANDVAFEMLIETGAARPAPYAARQKWVMVDDPSTFPDADLRQYLTQAHTLIAARLSQKLQRSLGLAN